MLLNSLRNREITDGERESSRRAFETQGTQPSDTITLVVATNHQIMSAIHDDDLSNPTIDLAKQGLYNGDDTFTIFHPNNRNRLNQLIMDNGGETSDLNVFRRKDFQKIIQLASDDSSILYLN